MTSHRGHSHPATARDRAACRKSGIVSVHPDFIGTPAETCRWCFDITYGVALECASQNMGDDYEYDTATEWAAEYVTSGTVSAYYCTKHDPINS